MNDYLAQLIEENKKLKEQLRKSMNYHRGDIVFVKMRKKNPDNGSVEEFSRPYLIVSNDTGNYHSDICLGVPLTSKLKNMSQPTHYRTSYKDSVAICEQIRTLSQYEMAQNVNFHIPDEEMREINKCLKISLALD